jgi:hypothetical protein
MTTNRKLRANDCFATHAVDISKQLGPLMSPEPHNLTQKALTVFSVVRKTPLLSHFSI